MPYRFISLLGDWFFPVKPMRAQTHPFCHCFCAVEFVCVCVCTVRVCVCERECSRIFLREFKKNDVQHDNPRFT